MLGAGNDGRIPEAVPPLPLPEFEYCELEKRERIGTGGDADVYRATIDHNDHTYPVAIKQPRFEGTIQRRVLEKFQTEAQTWSNLADHDNIVSVYAWGMEPLPWLALEFMDGGTLNARIGSVDVAEALWLSGRIAEGIRHGHRHGVAHLDIKPTNLLLRDTPAGKWDYPKVSDWGLAKLLLEHSNSIEGISPTYAAPEQFDADEYGSPDDITDIYQLGAVAYALLVGEPPFTGSSTAVMQGVLQEEPDPPSTSNPKVPAAVDDAVLKALAKQKDDRYQSVLLFRKELNRLFEEYVGGSLETTAASVDAEQHTSSDTAPTTESDETGEGVANVTRADAPTREQSTTKKNEESNSTVVSTQQRDSPESESSVLTRRRMLGILGVGVVGVGGGWMVGQTNNQLNDKNSLDSTSGTDANTPTASEDTKISPSETDPSGTAETVAEGPTTIIDDFETGELDSAWQTHSESSAVLTGREGFTVQSSQAPEGNYSLRGLYGGPDNQLDEYSAIIRDDFIIDQDDIDIYLYVKVGPVLSGAERANKIHFRGPETPLIRIDQKERPGDTSGAHIGNGNSPNTVLDSIQLVEFRSINFSGGEIEELVVGGETVATNMELLGDGNSITSIIIYQGHFGHSADVVVDGIVTSR